SIALSSLPDPFKMHSLSMCRNQTVEVPPVPSKLFWAAQKAVISFSNFTSSIVNSTDKYDRLMPLIKATLTSFPYERSALSTDSVSLEFLFNLSEPCPDNLLGTDYFFMEHFAYFLESLENIACAVGKDKFSID
ncbi:hypothetical protein PMAYCL1PPCAC_24392, partial [Pristionchus mayeri]